MPYVPALLQQGLGRRAGPVTDPQALFFNLPEALRTDLRIATKKLLCSAAESPGSVCSAGRPDLIKNRRARLLSKQGVANKLEAAW